LTKSILAVPVIAALAGLLAVGAALPAHAEVGSVVQSTGQYLTGSLLNASVTAASRKAIASYAGTGSAELDEPTNNLQTLAVQTLALLGGTVGVPADFSNIGVLTVHANANTDGSALGSSGLLNIDGTLKRPAPGSLTGTTSYNLSQAVTRLGVTGGAELGGLSLSLGVTSSSASRSANDVIARDYDIASGGLTFDSPTLAGLASSVNNQVTALQGTLNSYNGQQNAVANAIDALTNPAMNSSVTVSPVDLSQAVKGAGFQTGTLTDPAHPGVTIDLGSGRVTVDLAAITTLNGRAANTELITPALLQTINDGIAALVTSYGDKVTDALATALNPVTLGVTADPGNPVLGVTESIGDALAGAAVIVAPNTHNITGAAVNQALTAGISGLTGRLNSLTSTLLDPVTTTTFPAVSTVLASVLQLTVNVQSDAIEGVSYAAGAAPISSAVYREAALRIDLLPTLFSTPINALVLTIASSSVAAPGAFSTGDPSGPTADPAGPGKTLALTGGDAVLWFLPVAVAAFLIGFCLIDLRRRPRARH
jgi:hypothetical protein